MAGGSDSLFYRNLDSSDTTLRSIITATTFPDASVISLWGWTNPGYVPKEWNTQRNGSGTSYALGASLSVQTNYYLIWEADTTTYTTTATELTSIANAIRTKGGTQASLIYPTGFVSAIDAIPTGGGGWSLIFEDEVTTSTTSTSITSVKSVNTNISINAGKLLFVVVRDKAGVRNGYYTGTNQVYLNTYGGNVTGTASQSVGQWFRSNASGDKIVRSGAVLYGIYCVFNVVNSVITRVDINSRFSSSSSTATSTINGTYSVKVYSVDVPPNASFLLL